MDLRHYRSFIVLADERSFTAAARRLNIVQSGLSTTIKEMEEELGVRLVERTTRRVSLTDAGRLFLEYARPALTTLSDGLEAVRTESQIVRGRVRLGILQSLGPYINLPTVLQEFHAEYPEVDFAVRSVDSMRAPELVRSGDVDLSFHAEIAPLRLPGVEAIPFFQDTLVAGCAKSHPLASQERVGLDELVRFPFVDLTPERALRFLIDKCIASRSLRRKCVYEVNSVATMMQFVSAGLGVSIIPAALAESCATALRLHILVLQEQKPRLSKWKLVILACPIRQKLSGKTLPELLLAAITESAKISQAKRRTNSVNAINHLG